MSDPESKAHEEHESDDSSSDSEPETTTVEQPVEIDYTKLTAISPEVISKQVRARPRRACAIWYLNARVE